MYAAKRFSCGPGAERRDPTKQFYIKMFFYDLVVLEGFARWNAESIVLRAHYVNAPAQEHVIRCKGIIAVPARYFPDQFGADGSIARSLKERRSLLVEGIKQRPPDGWDPTEVEFNDSIAGHVERFSVDGAMLIRPTCLKLPILG